MLNITKQLANEFNISEKVVSNILALISEGASIPFIARYRKEATQGLDDVQLREFDQRQNYLTELNQRREGILSQLKESGRLTSQLEQAINKADTKKELEDLYAPFKQAKLSRVEQARKLGLDKIAAQLWKSNKDWNESLLDSFLESLNLAKNKEEISKEEIKSLVVELFSEEILLQNNFMQSCKNYFYKNAVISSKVIRGKKETGQKYQDYFDYSESLNKVPSHRLLALFRGKKEGFLKLAIDLNDNEMPYSLLDTLTRIKLTYPITQSATVFQKLIINQIWADKIHSKIDSLIFTELKESADIEATKVFARNLKDLLMASPAGQKRILALDPGFRNGVKIAIIDEFGSYLSHEVIYPHPPQSKTQESQKSLLALLKKYKVELVAIGNGTASRETESFVKKLIKENQLDISCIMVSESGASIYSASEIASKEFPDLDVTARGAISIARRLQDPLAELIKIDPQSIGVGQYQHDIKGKQLEQALNNVVEDCVNSVGVDLNLASTSLLTHVSGLSEKIAQNIVDYRSEKGAIKTRSELKKVKGIGDKCFEQCAGFLRINNGSNPLDSSGVHPESYPLVEKMLSKLGIKVGEVIGNTKAINQLRTLKSELAETDSYTFNDIVNELAKPGRDPRPEFSYVTFDQNIESIDDLIPGQILEGVATNIAAFGVFVDIGVHQDGLVHISQLADRFVKDPAELVKIGQIMKVEVLEVDPQRKRISLKALGLN